MVTHDVRGARRVADRILVIDKGTLVANGTAAEIEHRRKRGCSQPDSGVANGEKKGKYRLFVVGGLVLFGMGMFLIGDRHQAFARHIE